MTIKLPEDLKDFPNETEEERQQAIICDCANVCKQMAVAHKGDLAYDVAMRQCWEQASAAILARYQVKKDEQ